MLLPLIIVALSFAPLGLCAGGSLLGGLPGSNATRYTIDLDTDPEHRWDAVVRDHRVALEATSAFLSAAIPAKYLPAVEEVASLLDRAFPRYGAEMRGVARESGMDLGKIVLLNLLYTITVGCTSVVASGGDGHVLHSRNLDYGLPKVLRPLVAEVRFVRSGVPVFAGTVFAGAVGILTGVSPGGVSMSVDERDAPGAVWENLVELLVVRGSRPVTFFVRDVLESGAAFDAALETTFLTPILAPCYIIVGGTEPGQGAVVTRDRNDARDVWRMDLEKEDGWFRAETNYDHWVPPPERDSLRRKVIDQAMHNMTARGLSAESLVGAMQLFPVLRSSTIYSTTMAAATGELVTYIRNSTRHYA